MESLHIRLNTEEAINSKRDILYTEINLLNIIKKLQDYKKLRILELKSKAVLKTEVKTLLSQIKNLKNLLPKARIPEMQKVEIESEMGRTTRNRLELELKEIREELEKLG